MSRNPVLRDRIARSILDAAARVFAERGGAASMADFAAEAGVGRATLYRYFPNREALLVSLSESAMEELSERLAEAALDTAPVSEAVPRLIRAFVTTGSKYFAFIRSGHKPVDEAAVQRHVGEPLQALISRGIADGTLRGDLPDGAMAALLFGLLESAIALANRDGLGTERASAAAATVFLDGARSRS